MCVYFLTIFYFNYVFCKYLDVLALAKFYCQASTRSIIQNKNDILSFTACGNTSFTTCGGGVASSFSVMEGNTSAITSADGFGATIDFCEGNAVDKVF